MSTFEHEHIFELVIEQRGFRGRVLDLPRILVVPGLLVRKAVSHRHLDRFFTISWNHFRQILYLTANRQSEGSES